MIRSFLEDASEKNQLKKSLYRIIHWEKSISKMNLLQQFHVPNSTMTRMITELESRGLVKQCGLGQSSGGRPPVLYEVVPSAGFLIGVEISRTHVGIILVNLKFEVIRREQFTLSNRHNPQLTISLIIENIKILLSEYQISSLLGIGIGAVGPLDRDNGIILNPESFPSKGWRNVPIVKLLKEKFPVPVILNNGANTAAIAEYYVRSPSKESILYCISGYGIRYGFVQDGQLLNKKQGDASSFGHIIIKTDGLPCTCGNKGCLTSYVSFGTLFDRIKKKGGNPYTIDHLLNNKDPLIDEIILQSARYYGIGIANMINILHPDVVILHGKLISNYKNYFTEVVQVAKEKSYSDIVGIRKGDLGDKATEIGAAIQLFDYFFHLR